MKLNSNILFNLHKAIHEATTIKAATHEYRGVTNVWEVVRNMEKVFAMPGGVYNYGSCNEINSYELNLRVASMMGVKDPSALVLPDEERFSEQARNLTMDCSAIAEYDIHFNDSVKEIEQALRKNL